MLISVLLLSKMNVGCQFLILLGFLLIAAVFASQDCTFPAKMQENLKGHKSTFANGHLVLYCAMFCLLTVANCIQRTEKKCLNLKHLRYSVYPKQGIVQDMLEHALEHRRFSTVGDISEQKSKYHFATLFQLRHYTKQKYTVLPLSLEQYFQDRERNSNSADLMRYEWARYRTFCTFPDGSPARPIRLASNGFYYIGAGVDDGVKCFSCGLVYQGWKEGDVVADIHARQSPTCHFLTGVDKSNIGIHTNEAQTAVGCGNIAEVSENNEAHSRNYTEEVYVQKQCRNSSDKDATTSRRRQYKYPDYESYRHRMDTYTDWPCTEIIEPHILADAGYFYAGFSDCVRCFCCGGGLRNWEYGDGPWEEHARWFPDCLFLLERKGQGFIRQHKEAQADSDDTDARSPTTCTGQALNAVKENTQTCKLGSANTKPQENDGGNKATTNVSSNDERNDPKSLKEENTRLKNQLTCKICMDKESNMVFIPCGHMVSCETCAPNIRKCAICRRAVTGRVKAFMS